MSPPHQQVMNECKPACTPMPEIQHPHVCVHFMAKNVTVPLRAFLVYGWGWTAKASFHKDVQTCDQTMTSSSSRWRQHPNLDKESTIICQRDGLIFIFPKVRKHDFIYPFFPHTCGHLLGVIFSLTFQADINSFGPVRDEQWRKDTKTSVWVVNLSHNLDTTTSYSDILIFWYSDIVLGVADLLNLKLQSWFWTTMEISLFIIIIWWMQLRKSEMEQLCD